MKTIGLIRHQLLLSLFLLLSTTIFAQLGTVEADEGIIIGTNSSIVDGAIRYTGTDFQGRKAGSWASLTTGGASAWTISGANIYRPSGNVGIGPSVPLAGLHINSGTSEALRLQSNVPGLTLYGLAGTLRGNLNYDISALQLNIRNLHNGPIAFHTNGTEKFIIDGSGNVGIGSNLPTSRVEIVDNSNSSSATLSLIETTNNDFSRIFFENANNATDKWAFAGNVGTGVDHRIGFYYNGNPRMVYNETEGGLGLGTSDPVQKLHVKVTGNDGIRLEGDGTGDARIWLTNTAGGHFIFDDSDDDNTLAIQSATDLAFYTNGFNERMRINKLGGEIGINIAPNTNYRFRASTSNDLYCLAGESTSQQAVRGINNRTGNSAAYGVYGNIGAAPTGSKYAVYGVALFTSTGGSKYGVYGSSDAGDPNSWGVYANGDLWYTGTLMAPSDIRLKKNMQNLSPVLNKVMLLETKTYEFDREKYGFANLADEEQIGFIAQNVETLFPALVSSNTHSFVTNDGVEGVESTTEELNILGINSIGMIPVLTKAIQEQQELIETQRKEINELKILVDELINNK